MRSLWCGTCDDGNITGHMPHTRFAVSALLDSHKDEARLLEGLLQELHAARLVQGVSGFGFHFGWGESVDICRSSPHCEVVGRGGRSLDTPWPPERT